MNIPAELTSREIQLVALCAQGMSDKEVAQSLSLSVQTVATYWKRLKRRLNAGNRSEVIAMTLRGEVGIDRAAVNSGDFANVGDLHQGIRNAPLNALLAQTRSAVLFEDLNGAVMSANQSVIALFRLKIGRAHV